MEYLISILLSVTSGSLVFIVNNLMKENHNLREKKKNDDSARENAYTEAIICLLRDKLIVSHHKYVPDGSIPSYAYENWRKMYDSYKQLGGNGLIDGMNDDIEELTIV